MTKQALRQYYMEQRAALPLATRHSYLAHLLEHLEGIPWPKGGRVLSYRAMAAKNELPMEVVEDYLQEQSDAYTFAYPQAHFDTGSMEAFADDEALQWETARFGLEQPRSGHLLSPEAMDIVLVPLLAFDLQGYRLGYGKGFYDRYLARCRSTVLTIGFSWFAPVEVLPQLHPHDAPMRYCVTPQALYAF